MFMGNFLNKASAVEVNSLVVLMIVAQVVMLAIYDALTAGKISWVQICGFACAIASVVLLSRKTK
jgi:drug/metabolite transporter (DMT)-like permease